MTPLKSLFTVTPFEVSFLWLAVASIVVVHVILIDRAFHFSVGLPLDKTTPGSRWYMNRKIRFRGPTFKQIREVA